MSIAFRPARRDEVPAILALLRDDALGAAREGEDMEPYLAAFDRMEADPSCVLIAGESEGRVIACYQMHVLPGLSLRAATRAQIEGVRVASGLREQGIGARLVEDAMERARAAGCTLMQLTTNRSRADAHRFYERLGFTPSHIGYKRDL